MLNKKHEKYDQVKDMSHSQQITAVKHIFTTISSHYDFLNRFFSLRRDVAWRRFTANKMHFFQSYRFLDVATGTADLAIMAAINHPTINITGMDFIEEMLALGEKKIKRLDLSNRIGLVRGDALALPFPDNHFDIAGMAFGIRNVPDWHQALKEMMRVTVQGGQVMILEMYLPKNNRMHSIYHFYLNHILPYLARFFSKNPSAYHYLSDTIVHFPSAEVFQNMMEAVGLSNVTRHALTLGIAYLHIGMKPRNLNSSD